MVLNLDATRYRKMAEDLDRVKKRYGKFLTDQERAALGCAAYRAKAEANLIERMGKGGEGVLSRD